VKISEENMQKHRNSIFTGTFLGRMRYKLSPAHQPETITQKTTARPLAPLAWRGPEAGDPRDPVLSCAPSAQPSSEHFLHAVDIHEMVPALLANFI